MYIEMTRPIERGIHFLYLTFSGRSPLEQVLRMNIWLKLEFAVIQRVPLQIVGLPLFCCQASFFERRVTGQPVGETVFS